MQPQHNRFQAYRLDPAELEQGKAINPYTYVLIQNKVSEYAHAVVEFQYNTTLPIEPQVIEHEKLKAMVQVLEELMQELTPPVETADQQH